MIAALKCFLGGNELYCWNFFKYHPNIPKDNYKFQAVIPVESLKFMTQPSLTVTFDFIFTTSQANLIRHEMVGWVEPGFTCRLISICRQAELYIFVAEGYTLSCIIAWLKTVVEIILEDELFYCQNCFLVHIF